MPEYRKEWLEKSRIDYFSPFIALWLSCNSWYRSHYADVGTVDRNLVDKIKSDYTTRNLLYKRFKDLFTANSRDGISFRTNIELLHYALENASVTSDSGIICSLRYTVLDYDHKSVTCDLTGKENDTANSVRLEKIWVTKDTTKLFPGTFEIMYQIRNMLIHGNINPSPEHHEIIKYCYAFLFQLMTGI